MRYFSRATLHRFLRSLRRGYGGEVRPTRDWFLLLIISLVILLGLLATNAVYFFQVLEGRPLSSEVDVRPESRSTQAIGERLKTVEELFGVRAEEHRGFLMEPYRFVDPARN